MKTLILVLLSVAVANARWSVYSTGKQNETVHDDMDWWEHGVFYQIYPSSFKDSDGDGRGDLQGITQNLSHLADLGVDGAWLSPIFDSPMIDGGYDISDFYNVNPIFGSNDDLIALFAEAKRLGIKIILDFVPNHTSDKHEWFIKSAARETGFEDYYVWYNCEVDGQGNITRYPNNWVAVFHTRAWSYHAVRGQCYLHQFTKEQPDLNYRNPAVYDAMMNILKHWLEQGADGFRIDAINHMYEAEGIPDELYYDNDGDRESYDNLHHNMTMNRPESYEFIYAVRKMMDEFVVTKNDNMTRLMMTEAYASLEETIKWYGNDTHPGAHMPFNFALITGLDKMSDASDFKKAIDSWTDTMPVNTVANWVMGNHDRSRVGFRYGEDRHEGLAIMTMMLPGINVVYYGEEILMTDNRNITWEQTDDPQAINIGKERYMEVSRDPVRTPFQWDETVNAGFSYTTGNTWLPVHKDYLTQNLKAQKGVANSTFTLYQNLIKLRKSNHVVKAGGIESKIIGNNVFAFLRTMKDMETVAVFLNLASNTTVSLKELLHQDDFNDKTKAKVLMANNNSTLKIGDDISNLEEIVLGPYDAIVLEISSASKLAVSLLLIAAALIKFIF